MPLFVTPRTTRECFVKSTLACASNSASVMSLCSWKCQHCTDWIRVPERSRIQVRSGSREELVDITDQVRAAVHRGRIAEGVIHLWSMHTTCGLTVNEG